MISDPGEPSTGHPRVPVTAEEAEILAVLAWGRTVLEIGTGLGVSTRALARGATSVTTVDIDPWVHEEIWPQWPRFGKVACVKRDDLASYMRDNEFDHSGWDLAFIDADHTTEAVAADVEFCSRHARILVAHDANYSNVQRGLGQGWTILPTEHGIGIRCVEPASAAAG